MAAKVRDWLGVLAGMLAAVAMTPAEAATTKIYRCTADDGSITFTDTPCAAGTKSEVIQPDPADSPRHGHKRRSQSKESAPADTSSAPQAPHPPPAKPSPAVAQCTSERFGAWLRSLADLPDQETRSTKLKQVEAQCRALNPPTPATHSAPTPGSRVARNLPNTN